MENKLFYLAIGLMWGLWISLLILILYYVHDAGQHLASIDNKINQFATVDDLKSLTK